MGEGGGQVGGADLSARGEGGGAWRGAAAPPARCHSEGSQIDVAKDARTRWCGRGQRAAIGPARGDASANVERNAMLGSPSLSRALRISAPTDTRASVQVGTHWRCWRRRRSRRSSGRRKGR
eukprot:773740-Rhodomonas_salina.1